MARAGRPASESYQPVCYSGSQSISFSSEAGSVGQEDDDDRAPIFSLSKSSMDVVMATGPLHKRDPAWIRTDLRRSSSTNTPTEQTPQSSVTLKQLHPHMLHHINVTSNSQQVALTAQNMEVHSPPGLTDRWIANMQRWSECSSTQSRSSTPDTIVWKDGTSRPSSLSQEAPYSPISKLASSPTTPSPLISPLQTPTLLSEDLLTSSSLQTLSTNQQKDFLTSSPAPSPLRTPLQPDTSSALPSNSPNLPHPTSAEDEGFLENNLLTFIFPSPVPSSVSLGEGASSISPGCFADGVIEELHASPGGPQLLEGGGATVPSAEPSPVQMLSYLTPNSPAKGQESEASVCYLELPGQSCPASRGWRSPMVYSVSDSQLGECCKCHLNTREGITKAPKIEEGTMTSQPDLVDAAVQTTSPIGSLWGLRRNVSTTNMGSHSILGSPPGSRLNLKASVGSNSNLVSPSSSMFPVSSEEEDRRGDEQTWDSPSLHDLDKRRSCLKRGEEGDEMGRRSSMKQVQWDEDGMTWDVHGASVDPEVLSSAIQKHLELQNSPQPAKRSSKKKKAPKPPLLSNVVKAMTPEINPPVTIITSTCMAEGESKETPDKEREVEKEEEGESKKEEPVEAVRRLSRAEADNAKEDSEVYGEEGASHPKSPSQVSTHSRKKSVIRALRRPRWCGGSKKADD